MFFSRTVANRTTAALAALLVVAAFCTGSALADEIKIDEVKQSEPVDFAKQILPILRKKCLACHNSTEAESDFVM